MSINNQVSISSGTLFDSAVIYTELPAAWASLTA